MRVVNKSKKEQIGAKFENAFPFFKTINFTVINVIRYQLEPLKCSFMSTKEAIETCYYLLFDYAKSQNQWD